MSHKSPRRIKQQKEEFHYMENQHKLMLKYMRQQQMGAGDAKATAHHHVHPREIRQLKHIHPKFRHPHEIRVVDHPEHQVHHTPLELNQIKRMEQHKP